ncbi:MAG: hypothetical protein LCH89_15140 [Proteobacteria bacterium]|nr:hypothetical protein [Pseudomonadota bacterium]
MAMTDAQKKDAYQFFIVAFGAAPGVTYMNQLNDAYSAGMTTKQIVNVYTTKSQFQAIYPAFMSNTDFAAKLVDNVVGSSATDAAKTQAKADVVAALNAGWTRGDTIYQIFTNLAAKTGDATWGGTAAMLANKVTVSQYFTETKLVSTTDLGALQALVANVTSDPASVAAAQAAGNQGQTSTLTTAQDVFTGGSGEDVIRGVAGVQVGGQDQTTLNSSDVLDGGAGNDKLVINMTGAVYNGGATIKNIETVQIGTDLAGAVNFDYNVNNGAYEVTGTNTVVYDQITVGEQLNVNNLTPTASGTNPVPGLSWVNEAGSLAGIAAVTYRAATVAGATNQALGLTNVSANNVNAASGQFNMGAGVETLTITSAGAGANTLNNSANQSGTGGPSDLVSGTGAAGTALASVVALGAAGLGKAATVVTQAADANYGLTNRAVGVDTGLSDARSSASNLLSLADTVTSYDASAATGDQAVRFTAKAAINTPTNVTYKGGTAKDYVEFELGNVNASGGTGDDTFAFVNANSANSSFGEGDSVVGGAGTDTLQLGVNGVGNYVVSETELRNKTGVDVIDLRGNNTSLTLSQDFVNAADTAGTITIITNKIVQTSDTNAANDTVVATNNGRENASTNTVNLSMLGSGQSVSYQGGSGSDRLIMNDATFNVLKTLDGGALEGQVIAAGATRYDTITLVTNGERVVVDAQDLSNVRNFEGFVLTKNAMAAIYDLSLTRAFLTANTLAANDATNTPAFNDTAFTLATANAANNRALGAGDVVNINVADLLNAANAGLAAGVAPRQINVQSLIAAGVTVNFIGNGGAAVTLATLTGLGLVDATMDNINSVIASAAFPGAAPLAFTGTVADEVMTLTAATDSVDMGGGADTINVPGAMAATGNLNGGAGVDILNVGAGANISGATVTNVETLTLNGAATMTVAQYNAFTTTNAAGLADVVTLSDAGTITARAGVETYNFTNAGTDTLNSTFAILAAAPAINLGTLAGITDTLTVTDAVTAAITLGAAQGAEVVNLNGGVAAAVVTVSNAAGTVVNLTGAAGQVGGVVTLGTGGQTVNVTNAAVSTGTYTLTGNTGADNFNLSGAATGSGAVTINDSVPATASLVTAIDTVTGFRAGVDKFKVGAAGAQLTLSTMTAPVDTVGLAAALSTAVTNAVTPALGGNAANYNAAGDALIVTIASGTAAGTYLVANAGATNGAFTAAEDVVIKLVGTVGVITATDIIV